MDVTELRKTLKQQGLKFFPAYLWLVTRNLNLQPEFKVAEVDGVLGYYETLTPLYAHFHERDHTFSLMWTEFSPFFSSFYRSYLENQETYGENLGVLSQPMTLPPPNAYTVSALPWVSFNHFAVHSYESKAYYFPSVEAGKFFERDGRIMIPLSITCHHATTDGYHIKTFLESLQQDMDNFQVFL